MTSSNILIAAGLAMNTVASLIMLYPYINIKKKVDDDFIVKMNIEAREYTQVKHLKDRKLGITGFSLFAFGFFLQLLGIIISS